IGQSSGDGVMAVEPDGAFGSFRRMARRIVMVPRRPAMAALRLAAARLITPALPFAVLSFARLEIAMLAIALPFPLLFPLTCPGRPWLEPAVRLLVTIAALTMGAAVLAARAAART
ncbi:MAG TPA: hypothetical protein VHO91_00120, partial [Rhodopila sp.]|nr:hypothetical protein [Rhodopila sp.]